MVLNPQSLKFGVVNYSGDNINLASGVPATSSQTKRPRRISAMQSDTNSNTFAPSSPAHSDSGAPSDDCSAQNTASEDGACDSEEGAAGSSHRPSELEQISEQDCEDAGHPELEQESLLGGARETQEETTDLDLAASGKHNIVLSQSSSAAAGVRATSGPQSTGEALLPLLPQALEIEDFELVETVLEFPYSQLTVATAVRRLSHNLLLPFIHLIANRLHEPKNISYYRLLFWLKTILTTHMAYLTSQPSLVFELTSLAQMLNARSGLLGEWCRLHGKLQLLLDQLHQRNRPPSFCEPSEQISTSQGSLGSVTASASASSTIATSRFGSKLLVGSTLDPMLDGRASSNLQRRALRLALDSSTEPAHASRGFGLGLGLGFELDEEQATGEESEAESEADSFEAFDLAARQLELASDEEEEGSEPEVEEDQNPTHPVPGKKADKSRARRETESDEEEATQTLQSDSDDESTHNSKSYENSFEERREIGAFEDDNEANAIETSGDRDQGPFPEYLSLEQAAAASKHKKEKGKGKEKLKRKHKHKQMEQCDMLDDGEDEERDHEYRPLHKARPSDSSFSGKHRKAQAALDNGIASHSDTESPLSSSQPFFEDRLGLLSNESHRKKNKSKHKKLKLTENSV